MFWVLWCLPWMRRTRLASPSNLLSLSVHLHSVENVGGARHCLGSSWEKKTKHKTVSQHNILTWLIYRFATLFFKQECCMYESNTYNTVVKILNSLGIFGDLQKWRLSLFYLGSLICSGWGWCWHSRGAKAIKVAKIPKNVRTYYTRVGTFEKLFSILHKNVNLSHGCTKLYD